MGNREDELLQKITRLENEVAMLQDQNKLLEARTSLAWMGMLSSFYRHNLNKSAATVLGIVDLMQEHLRTHKNPDVIYLDKKMEIISELMQQAMETPILAPLDKNSGVELLDINLFISEWIQRLQRIYKPSDDIQIQLDLEPKYSVVIQCNPQWLKKGLDIIIDNSIIAMESSQRKVLIITTKYHDQKIKILIKDTGPGIPEPVLPDLLSRPIPKSMGEKGLGMGLLMAQMIFQTYNGQLSLEQTGSEGTTFSITLPVANR